MSRNSLKSEYNNIKMRTDINKNALLVSLIVACEKVLDDNPIFILSKEKGITYLML